MKKCNNCGADNTDDAEVCSFCNSLIITDSTSEDARHDTSEIEPNSQKADNPEKDTITSQPESKSKSKILTTSKAFLIISAIGSAVSGILNLCSMIFSIAVGIIVAIPVALLPYINEIITSLNLGEAIVIPEGENMDFQVLFSEISSALGIAGVVILVMFVIALIAYAIGWSIMMFLKLFIPLKLVGKINKSTTRKQVMGWAIANIVLFVIQMLTSTNVIPLIFDALTLNIGALFALLTSIPSWLFIILGLVGGILTLTAKDTEYSKPKK